MYTIGHFTIYHHPMKKLLFLLFSILLISQTSQAIAQDFEIIPKATDSNIWSKVDDIWQGGKVREKYNQAATSMDGQVWDQFASWVFTRTTILDYLVYLIKFLSQAWLLIWACMIIYAWYIYASSAFMWWDVWWGKKAITNAIIWVLVVVFSYAIMKLVTAAFLT